MSGAAECPSLTVMTPVHERNLPQFVHRVRARMGRATVPETTSFAAALVVLATLRGTSDVDL